MIDEPKNWKFDPDQPRVVYPKNTCLVHSLSMWTIDAKPEHGPTLRELLGFLNWVEFDGVPPDSARIVNPDFLGDTTIHNVHNQEWHLQRMESDIGNAIQAIQNKRWRMQDDRSTE